MAPHAIDPGPLNGQPLCAAVSDAMVKLLRDRVGRGPARARTTLRDNVLVVVLEDGLTTAERSLLAAGKADEALELRSSFQRTLEPEMVGTVERLSGRRVLAYMSANHLDPDMAMETFVLEPLIASNGNSAQVIEQYDPL
jgi:uncharacterized protein YbcI